MLGWGRKTGIRAAPGFWPKLQEEPWHPDWDVASLVGGSGSFIWDLSDQNHLPPGCRWVNESEAQDGDPTWSYWNLGAVRTGVTFKAMRLYKIQEGKRESDSTKDRAPTHDLPRSGRCSAQSQGREDAAKERALGSWCRAQAGKEEGRATRWEAAGC